MPWSVCDIAWRCSQNTLVSEVLCPSCLGPARNFTHIPPSETFGRGAPVFDLHLSIICTSVFAYLNTEVLLRTKDCVSQKLFSLLGSPVLCCCYLEGEELHGSGLSMPKTVCVTAFAVTGVSRSQPLLPQSPDPGSGFCPSTRILRVNALCLPLWISVILFRA